MEAEMITITISALLTIMVLTYVYKDSVLFRLADNLFVGLAFAIVCVTGVSVIYSTAIVPATKGNYAGIPGLILGLLMFTRFAKRYAYISRWSLALLMGVGSGISLGGAVYTQVTQQMQAIAATTLFGVDSFTALSSLLTLVFSVCSILFFIFTIKQTGSLSVPSKIGRYALMITFGTAYGMTVTGRYALLSEKISLIIRDWLMVLLGLG